MTGDHDRPGNRFINDFPATDNQAVAEELLAPDFVDSAPFPGFGSMYEDVKNLFRMLRATFQDLPAQVVEQFVQQSEP